MRVTVRRPAGLGDGEYRSHLQFDRVADATAATNLETAAQPEKGQVAIVLQALVGASIPVIVRQGQTSASVTLDSLALVPARADTPSAVTFQFHRQGNQSVYGDIAVSYVTPSGKSHELAQMNGIAVYVPNATRTMRVALNLPEGVALKGGTLKVRYNERPDAGGKLLAENAVSVP